MSNFDKFKEEKMGRIDMVIGNEISYDKFIFEMNDRKGQKFIIRNGWNLRDEVELRDIVNKHAITGGIIDVAICRENNFIVGFDDGWTERYTIDSIQKITQNDNTFYIIYNDNSYFLINVSKICPKCKKNELHEDECMNALSRIDNETEICDECGQKEAFEDMGLI